MQDFDSYTFPPILAVNCEPPTSGTCSHVSSVSRTVDGKFKEKRSWLTWVNAEHFWSSLLPSNVKNLLIHTDHMSCHRWGFCGCWLRKHLQRILAPGTWTRRPKHSKCRSKVVPKPKTLQQKHDIHESLYGCFVHKMLVSCNCLPAWQAHTRRRMPMDPSGHAAPRWWKRDGTERGTGFWICCISGASNLAMIYLGANHTLKAATTLFVDLFLIILQSSHNYDIQTWQITKHINKYTNFVDTFSVDLCSSILSYISKL